MAFHTGDKIHNYFYRITNQLNWKFYFGIHSTNNLDDGYMGSSKAIRAAIKKYGKENFVKVVIQDYPTRKEASDHEKMAVTLIQVEDEMCYNIKTGGDNEFVFIPTEETRKKMSISGKNKKKYSIEFLEQQTRDRTGKNNPNFGKSPSDEVRQKLSIASKGKPKTKEHSENISKSLMGHPVSEETRKKLSKSLTGKFVVGNSPNFGIIRTDEWKKKHKETRKRRKLLIDGQIFESVVEAANSFNVSEGTVRNRVNSTRQKWAKWQDYPPKDEK